MELLEIVDCFQREYGTFDSIFTSFYEMFLNWRSFAAQWYLYMSIGTANWIAITRIKSPERKKKPTIKQTPPIRREKSDTDCIPFFKQPFSFSFYRDYARHRPSSIKNNALIPCTEQKIWAAQTFPFPPQKR